MKFLLQALTAAALLAVCVAALQVTFLLAATIETVADFRLRSGRTLDALEATASTLHGAAVEQRRYYKATGKILAIATADFARLVKNTDQRLERVTQEAELTARSSRALLQDTRRTLQTLDTQVYGTGYAAQAALDETGRAARQISTAAAHPSLGRTAAELEASAANVRRGTSAAAEFTENLRDATSPRKRRFWSTVLHWLLPRPSIPVRP